MNLFRLWVYFKSGHSGYLAFFVGLVNTTILQYAFIVSRIPTATALFGSMAAYLVAYFVLYFPFAILVGYVDFRRGTVPARAALNAVNNPYTMDLTLSGVYYNRAFIAYFNGDMGAAFENMERSTLILEKWARDGGKL